MDLKAVGGMTELIEVPKCLAGRSATVRLHHAITLSEELPESLTVLTSLSEMGYLTKLDDQLKWYLLKVDKAFPYLLPKFLSGLAILWHGTNQHMRLW
ncbi:MAG TPA: hypothetical protein VLK82_21865 [Candidatus Tectomicrobia bacterium]|nr:hypothetical protein [Candidatus Tectomicrobia bacterium]